MTEDSDPTKAAVAQRVQDARELLESISRDLHANPETAYEEVRSASVLADHLRQARYAVQPGIGGLPTAFHATRGSGPLNVCIAAEYDALPGLGHACGHNLIAAAAAGAAIGLGPVADELGLTVHVLGTPAEEGGGGKIALLDAGAFDGIDLAMMVHPGPADSVHARPRAVAHWTVEYAGKTAHAGAFPHLGVNAADAFTVAQVAIGLLRQQLPSHVRVHGVVLESGTAANAIPDRARGRWYVRASTLAELEGVADSVRRCFEAGALATGCTMELTLDSPPYSEFVNDPGLLASFAANADALGRDMDVDERASGGMNTASTDMGNVSLQIPSIHPYLSVDCPGIVNHQLEFAAATLAPAGDRMILDGATAMAWTVVDAARARTNPSPDRTQERDTA